MLAFLYYKGWGGIQKAVEIELKHTGLEVKKQLIKKDTFPPTYTAPPPEELQLLWKGNIIENNHTLLSYGIKKWDTIAIMFGKVA